MAVINSISTGPPKGSTVPPENSGNIKIQQQSGSSHRTQREQSDTKILIFHMYTIRTIECTDEDNPACHSAFSANLFSQETSTR